ncbi:hypothetical protein [Flagellimonas marinaquae]|uniref:hypothetical protein n=1 Tax=Flagellimonas marinaquae TaxID=254955 RepID=UPI000F8CD935|nr:hypothetical protein [Allomuricauda aquimarina]
MVKRAALYIINELFNSLLGFIVGAITSNLMLSFFEVRGWSNLWGLYASKVVLDDTVFTILEWTISLSIGYMFMKLVNIITIRTKKHFRYP